MPYKFETDKLKIPRELKKTVKLSKEDKELIIMLKDEYSQRALARMFKVSRRLIQFILYPDKLEENIKRRKEKGGSKIYYNKDKFRKAMKKHRDYKKELNKKEVLK